MAVLATWLDDHGHPLVDLRAGAQRLEDVFRRLTTDRTREAERGNPS